MQPINVTDEEIVEMIMFPVVNEACRVLDDGVVVRASDLDTASVLGMSFPSYRFVVHPTFQIANFRYTIFCVVHFSITVELS